MNDKERIEKLERLLLELWEEIEQHDTWSDCMIGSDYADQMRELGLIDDSDNKLRLY